MRAQVLDSIEVDASACAGLAAVDQHRVDVILEGHQGRRVEAVAHRDRADDGVAAGAQPGAGRGGDGAVDLHAP